MLEELFTKKITTRMIEYVVSMDSGEFNKKDVYETLGVSQPSVDEAFKICKEFNLIRKTRRLGRSTLYKTNTENPLYGILKKLVMEVSSHKFEVDLRNGD